MEPFVIDWVKGEAEMVRNRSQYSCLLLIILFLSRFFSQVNSAEGVLPDNEFQKIRKNTNLTVKPLQNVTF